MTLGSVLNSMIATAAPVLKERTFWMPEQGAVGAPAIDWVFNFINYLCYFFFVGIVFFMVLFMIKYRRPRGTPAQSSVTHNTPLELTWSIIPLILVIAIFYVGMKGYVSIISPPLETYEVEVTAQKWNWTFRHKNGAQENAVLKVPANRPVRLVMQSQDVLHALFIPAFRVKQDLVPGRYTQVWFEAVLPEDATEMKTYPLMCAEYCGEQHSQMLARVEVYPPDQFEAVIQEVANQIDRVPDDELACFAGRKLFAYCSSCHTLDGRDSTGPTWQGLWDRTRRGETVFADGTTLAEHIGPGKQFEVPENYLLDSILNPQGHIVQNRPGSMPTFKGQLRDREMRALVEFIKRLDEFVDANGNLVIPEDCGDPEEEAAPPEDGTNDNT